MKVLLYLESDFGQNEIKRGSTPVLATTLHDAANLKIVLSHVIGSDLFPLVHRIETKKFETMETLVRKCFRDLSRILAIVVIEGQVIKVHWRDHILAGDTEAMQKLQNKLHSAKYRHHLGFSMTAQE
jgi:hypothetical protein